jgi:DhnA family fructose-bisphosphate aldolase class Ia
LIFEAGPTFNAKREELSRMFTRRLKRIFKDDGQALIVAFDHGLTEGPAKGMEAPAEILTRLVAGGADAILTSYGIATRFAAEIAELGLILRLDVGGTKLGKMGPGSQYFQVEDALRIGADAVAVSAFPGTLEEKATLQTLAKVIMEAHQWGLPVMAEMQPGGFDAGPEFCTPESISLSARIAAEFGADWVKVPYTNHFQQVVQTCYVPAVMLGGVKVNDQRRLFETVWEAKQAGAAGIAIGRNIFQADDPSAVVKALAAILHQNASVDEASAIYEQTHASFDARTVA